METNMESNKNTKKNDVRGEIFNILSTSFIIMVFLTVFFTMFSDLDRLFPQQENELEQVFEGLGQPNGWEFVDQYDNNDALVKNYERKEPLNVPLFINLVENIALKPVEELQNDKEAHFDMDCLNQENNTVNCTARFDIIFAGSLGEKHIDIKEDTINETLYSQATIIVTNNKQ